MTQTMKPKANPSLLIVYTGNGKGKTTAALGLAFRALGRKRRVAIVQFIKGKWETGERLFAETLKDLDFHVMGLGFTWESDDLDQDKAAAQAAWQTAQTFISKGEHDVVILDELTYTLHYDFLALDDVVETLRNRPAHVDVVVTGRDAPQAIVDLADLVSEMKCIKHPYDQGWPAKRGVDF